MVHINRRVPRVREREERKKRQGKRERERQLMWQPRTEAGKN